MSREVNFNLKKFVTDVFSPTIAKTLVAELPDVTFNIEKKPKKTSTKQNVPKQDSKTPLGNLLGQIFQPKTAEKIEKYFS